MTRDPRQILLTAPMSALQIIAVGVTIGLNALDGFDVLSISFASPGIAQEWGLRPDGLGIVLSMELIGMAFGSVVLGGVADKIGRRPTILGCLVVMTAGMVLATTAGNPYELSIWRVMTGLGIGGMLAAINAVAAEFSSARRRHLSVSIMSIGYPLGAVVGGMITAQLLKSNDWRSVFYLGAAATALLIPLVYFFVPESVHWLAQKQPKGALAAINTTMQRMGHGTVSELPPVGHAERKRSIGDVFGPGLVTVTLLVTAAYFFHILTFYFMLKWVPKIVVNMGFPPSSAAGVLVWANAGGAAGGAVLGLLTLRYGVKGLTMGMMALSTLGVILFGQTPADLQRLSMICAAVGFCTNGAIVGMYAIFAQAFPTHVRAFGTGVAVGIGRGGSVLAPIVAGFLFEAGIGVPIVALIMSFGSLLAAGVLAMLRLRPDPPLERQERAPALKDAPATS